MMFFKITKSVTSVEITNNTFKFLITDFDFTKNCNQKSTSNMNCPQKVGPKTNLDEVSFFMTKYSTKFKMKIVREYLNKEDQLSNVKRK